MAGGCPNGQRGIGLKPNVAATPLRWVDQSNESNNLNQVVAVCARVGIATTALRLGCLLDDDPQGSALRATLGFGTESRWDSWRVEFESPHLSRVRVWNRKQRQRRCGPQPNVVATPLRWVTNQTNRTTSTRLWPFVREWESPQPRLRLEMFVER